MKYENFSFIYASQLPPLTEAEYQELKADIGEKGVLIPIIATEDNEVLDGQHRLRIAKELNLDINTLPFDVRLGLTDQQKQGLALDLNLHRRHLSKEQRKELVVKLRQNGMTNQAIADKLNVNEKTVRNDIKSVSENSETQLPKIVTGKDGKIYPTIKKGISNLTEKEQQPADITRIQARSTNEWYTPQVYLDSAKEVLGTFDFDPASSKKANDKVKAKVFYTVDDDSLNQAWHGKVWLNPPYGRLAGEFAQKLVLEYETSNVTEAILLVNANSTDTRWFADLWNYVLCFTDHRIDFSSPDNEGNNNSTHGSVFIYLGENKDHFQLVFSKHGVVVEKRKLDGKYQKS